MRGDKELVGGGPTRRLTDHGAGTLRGFDNYVRGRGWGSQLRRAVGEHGAGGRHRIVRPGSPLALMRVGSEILPDGKRTTMLDQVGAVPGQL